MDRQPTSGFGDEPAQHVDLSGVAAESGARFVHGAMADVDVDGYGPTRRVLLGSVSAGVVHGAACPVIVVPRGVNAPTGPASGRHAVAADLRSST